MENTFDNKPEKHICVGILAHVDAGKTTLSESILYLTGNIRKLGRVDHGDAFLDTYELERSRGITIFSKQAVFELGEMSVTLLDTPGHVDFSAEMERTLQVLDYAVLVINGADGVQGHTRTLWKLLRMYRIPVFLFVNKMDQEGTDQKKIMDDLHRSLDEGCVVFHAPQFDSDAFFENAAMCDEEALEEYLNSGKIKDETIASMIEERKIYPCYFGSALKVQGVRELLNGLEKYMRLPERKEKAQDTFGARVYKISRDAQGNRLTHLKVTSGRLVVKDSLTEEEKINQIRVYSGEKYEMVKEAVPGMVCAVT
ncbi:MAG: GTP-binding protein, partial [Lachnospiraceae bacterium]